MKTMRNTADQLILENRPWLLGALIIVITITTLAAVWSEFSKQGITGTGLFFLSVTLLICGICFGAFVRRTMVIFDRSTDTITIRRKSVFGMKEVVHELRYMERAVVERSPSDDSKTYRCEIILNGGMSKGRHPLTQVYSSGRGPKRAADAINDWLRQG